jgi:hypothetical protein
LDCFRRFIALLTSATEREAGGKKTEVSIHTTIVEEEGI